jgi:PAS domain S-box-containing protein
MSPKGTSHQGPGQAMQTSDEQFRALADAIPQLAWIAHADGFIYWYNRRWYEYTGTTPEQMEGWGWQSVHDSQVLPQVLAQWKRSIATGNPFDMVFPLRGADGRFRPFLTRVQPLKDARGAVVRWFGTNTDVEELKRAEEALHESEERLRLAQQAARVGTFSWDLQSGQNTWTPELEALYGLRPGEFGETQPAWEQLVHPEDRPNAVRLVEQGFQTGEPVEGEWRVVWPDGSLHWLAGRWQVYRDTCGRSERMTGVNWDITGRKQAEAALRENEARYRALFENMRNGFAYCRMIFEDGKPQDFVYLAVNPAFAELTGLKDVVGKKVSEVVPGIRETDPQVIETYGRVALTGTPEQLEVHVQALGMWFAISVYSPAKEHFAAVFDVITARKKAEEELRRTNEELIRFNQVTVGRELRIIELKKLVNELCAKLGQPARFKTDYEPEA